MSRFNLIFERWGGVTGIPIKFEINSKDMSEDEQKIFSDLINKLQNATPQKVNTITPIPDQFEYELIIKKGDSDNTFTWKDQDASDHHQNLNAFLKRLQRNHGT